MANAQQAALAVAGAAIGFAIPVVGPMMGFQIGLVAGGLLFPEDLPSQQGPRIKDSAVTSSTIGSAIAEVFGTTVVAGNITWSGPLVEIANTEDVGGKGGPSQEVTTYTYTRSYAVHLCRGPITGVLRIWRNEKLVYDLRPQQDDEEDEAYAERAVASEAFGDKFTLYLGAEDQLADPTMEAIEGAGNVPAHRGTAYVVFMDEDVTDMGGRPPNWRFEVVVSGIESTGANTDYAPAALYPWALGGSDPRNCLNDHEFQARMPGNPTATLSGTWHSSMEAAVAEISTYKGRTVSGTILGYGEDAGSADGVYPHQGQPSEAEREVLFLHINEAYFTQTSDEVVTGSGITLTCAYGDVNGGLWPDAEARWWIGPQNTGDNEFGLAGVYQAHSLSAGPAYDPPLHPGAAVSSTCSGLYGFEDPNGSGSFPNPVVSRVLDDIVACRRTLRVPDPPCEPRCEDPYPLLPESANYCVINGDLEHVVGYSVAVGSFKALSNYRVSGGIVTDYPLGPVIEAGSAEDTEAAWTARYEQAQVDGEVIRAGLVYGVDYPVTPATAYVRSFTYGILDPVSPTVGTIVAALCERAGLSGDRIDVSDLTETVHGYRIATPMSARQAIQPLQAYTFFDCVESECLLKFPTRGKAIVASLDEDSLGAHEPGGERPPLVSMERQQDVELPQLIRVHFENKDKNYEPDQGKPSPRLTTNAVNKEDVELAIAMDGDKAAQIADVLTQDRWWARETYRTIVSPALLALEPGDCIEIPVEGQSERARIIGMDMPLPFGPIPLQLARDDDGNYVSHAVGASPVPSTDTVNLTGPTVLEIIDGPALDARGDDAGVYVAVCGYFAGWRGATIYESVDGGTTFSSRLSISFPATMGTANDALPTGPTTIWDEGNTLTISLDNGSLESRTEEAVYSGANAAFYGAAGRWELIQFRNAALNMDGTYTLSGLLRGRRGTEWTVGLHEEGDRFVFVGQGVARLTLDDEAVGQTRQYKAVSLGTLVQAAAAESVTLAGVALECYSPANIRATRSEDGSILIECSRRSRYSTAMPSGADVPLHEETEAYELDVLSGETVLRTLTSTDGSFEYAVADQVEDFGNQAESFVVSVYQLSAEVGRGYPATETLVLSKSEAGPDYPVSMTLEFTGTFSASDVFTVGVLVGSISYQVTVDGSGLASLADMAQELADQLQAALPSNCSVSVAGDSVLVESTFGLSAFIANNTASVMVGTEQEPSPIAGGVIGSSYVDLWQSSGGSYSLAPEFSQAYESAGSAALQLVVLGATYAARKAIGITPAGFGAEAVTVSYTATGVSDYYQTALSGLQTAVDANTTLQGYGISAFNGSTPGEMSRPSVVLQATDDYQLSHPAIVSQTSAHPSGYKLAAQLNGEGSPAFPSGAKQLSIVYFGLPYGSPLAAGQKYTITIDGADYTYTVTAPDEAYVYDITPIFDGLKALIEAGALYTVTYYADMNYIEVERDAVNTAFTMDAYASYGARLTAIPG